ncbi:unnamed protein product [Discosporangium mesarthrocarpum]
MSEPEGLEGYIEWAESNLGVVVHHPLHLGSTPGKDERGVFCVDAVPPESILVSVPWEALLTVEGVVSTPMEPLLENGSREDDILCLLLLYHKHVLGEASPFWRHLVVLPEKYHQTVHYSEDELELLRGSSLHAMTIQWKSQVQADYKEVLALELKDGCTVGSAFSGFFTKEAYLWALSTVWSRFVTVERAGHQRKAMAPVFDMFNHSPKGQTVHGFQEANDCLHLVTLQAWEAGQEILISYGPMSNARLLLLHGFCLQDNPFDCVELWATMSSDAPGYAVKSKVLEERGVHFSDRPFKLTVQGFGDTLLPTLRVQRAEGVEIDSRTLEKAFLGEVLSRQNEQEVLEVLKNTLLSMLQEREASCPPPYLDRGHSVPVGREGLGGAGVATETDKSFASDTPEQSGEQVRVNGSMIEGKKCLDEFCEEAGGRPPPEDRRCAAAILVDGERKILRACLQKTVGLLSAIEQGETLD